MAVVLAFVMRILLLDALILSFVTIDIALDFWTMLLRIGRRLAMVDAVMYLLESSQKEPLISSADACLSMGCGLVMFGVWPC